MAPPPPRRGLRRSLGLLAVKGRFAAPAGAVWRRSHAALGFLQNRGVLPRRRAGLLGLPLALCFFPPSLDLSQGTARGLVSRPSPAGGAPPQPGHQPPRSGGAAKGGTKDKTAEGQPLKQPSAPVARVVTPHQREEAQGNLDVLSQSQTPAGQAKAEALFHQKTHGQKKHKPLGSCTSPTATSINHPPQWWFML